MPIAPWMQEGARVHNVGDACNPPKDGKISRVWTDKWNHNVEVTYDDGDVACHVTNSFYAGPLGSTARLVRLHSYELPPHVQEALVAASEMLNISATDALRRAIFMQEAALQSTTAQR